MKISGTDLSLIPWSTKLSSKSLQGCPNIIPVFRLEITVILAVGGDSRCCKGLSLLEGILVVVRAWDSPYRKDMWDSCCRKGGILLTNILTSLSNINLIQVFLKACSNCSNNLKTQPYMLSTGYFFPALVQDVKRDLASGTKRDYDTFGSTEVSVFWSRATHQNDELSPKRAKLGRVLDPIQSEVFHVLFSLVFHLLSRGTRIHTV